MIAEQQMSPTACLPRHGLLLLKTRTVMAAYLSAIMCAEPTSSGLAYVTFMKGSDRPHVLIKHLQTVYL